jgi:hypothetical protein
LTLNPSWPLNVVRAFALLSFDFHREETNDGVSFARGFAREAVVEVASGKPSTVSLLFSITQENRGAAWSAVCLTTLSSTLDVHFLEWLADEIRTNGLDSPWMVERRFDDVLVSARYLMRDAALVTLTVRPPRSAQSHRTLTQ